MAALLAVLSTSQTTVSNHGQHRSLQYIAWRLPAYAPGHPCCRGGPWSWPPDCASGTLWLSTACVCAIFVVLITCFACTGLHAVAGRALQQQQQARRASSVFSSHHAACGHQVHPPLEGQFLLLSICDALACSSCKAIGSAGLLELSQSRLSSVHQQWQLHGVLPTMLRSVMQAESRFTRILACSRPCSLLPWLAQRALAARRLGPSPGLAAVEPLPPPLTTASCMTALCWRGWTPRRRQSGQSERSAQKAKRMNAVAPSPTLAIRYS